MGLWFFVKPNRGFTSCLVSLLKELYLRLLYVWFMLNCCCQLSFFITSQRMLSIDIILDLQSGTILKIIFISYLFLTST